MTCPCCGETLSVAGIQQSFTGKPPKTIVICEVPECGMYLKSCTEREIEKNWQTWGSPRMDKDGAA